MRWIDREELLSLRHVLVSAVAAEHRLYQLAELQERQAERWRSRAELAGARGDADLAAQAQARAGEHQRRAARLREQYHAEAVRIRGLKRRMREVEAGRGPPPAPLALMAVDPLEARFEALQREERLERDLADLKARLGGPPAPTD